jgi:hypothetical protein
MGTDKQNSENILHVPFVAFIDQMLKHTRAYLINILVNYRDENWLCNITCHCLSVNKMFYFKSLFNAQFYPEGLKAYTRNIYKQRTQVK